MNGDLKEAALDTIGFRRRAKSRSRRRNRWSRSATSRSPIRLEWPKRVSPIVDNPDEADELTSRSNLIAVVTNGTAVLGLGAIGPLAGKPVMEGKGCLFKKFAGIDVFDIELAENDPDKLVETIARLEPTFGGINLEDIKAPECFDIEKKLRERMKIPVFHDDQHGTAIVAAAALVNGLALVGKTIADVKLGARGAGAAAIACIDLAGEARPRSEEGADRRPLGRRLRRPAGDDRREQGALRTTHPRPHARRRHRRRRYLSRPVGGGRPHPGHGQDHGPRSADLRHGEPRPGNPPRRRDRRAPGRDHRHRAIRLPEPDQQRPVLPVHFPRRARLRSDNDQRRDESRRRQRHRRTGPRGSSRRGRDRLSGRRPAPGRDSSDSKACSTRA